MISEVVFSVVGDALILSKWIALAHTVLTTFSGFLPTCNSGYWHLVLFPVLRM